MYCILLSFQETGIRKQIFRGHTDYLHCVISMKSSNQVCLIIFIVYSNDKILTLMSFFPDFFAKTFHFLYIYMFLCFLNISNHVLHMRLWWNRIWVEIHLKIYSNELKVEITFIFWCILSQLTRNFF